MEGRTRNCKQQRHCDRHLLLPTHSRPTAERKQIDAHRQTEKHDSEESQSVYTQCRSDQDTDCPDQHACGLVPAKPVAPLDPKAISKYTKSSQEDATHDQQSRNAQALARAFR
jgi:hypothetical protein